MSKIVIAGIIFVVILLISVGAYFMFFRTKSDGGAPPVGAPPVPPALSAKLRNLCNDDYNLITSYKPKQNTAVCQYKENPSIVNPIKQCVENNLPYFVIDTGDGSNAPCKIDSVGNFVYPSGYSGRKI